MTTISLRTLLRNPRKVKQLTRSGEAVQVNDNGEPLWILRSTAPAETEEKDRIRETKKIFDEVLQELFSPISAVGLLEESRR